MRGAGGVDPFEILGRPAGVKTGLPQCRICGFALGGGGFVETQSDDELVREE